MLLRLLRILAAAVGLVFLAPAVASADSYLVTSCTDPLGQPNAAGGWNPTSAPGGLTANSCGTANGALTAALDANPPATSGASWRFDAPAGTAIVRITGIRTTTGVSGSTQAADSRYQLTTNDQVLEECAPGPASSCANNLTGSLDRQGLSATYVEFRVFCGNGDRPCTRPLAVQATRMWPTLEDSAAPAVANAMVTDDGDSSGVLRAHFDATDVGGGLYRMLVKVDGVVAQTIPLALAPCVDADPSDANAYQFTEPVPCPLSLAGVQTVVEAAKLTAGPHNVEVVVEDAAGNQTAVVGPVQFPKANSGVMGASTPAQLANVRKAALKMWFVKARNHGRRYKSRFGTRVVTRGILRGRDGRPIQGARIDVYHIRKGKRVLKTGLKSRAGGKLTLILPLNVDTRQIEFAYRAVRPGPITSRQRLSLTVLRKGKAYHRK